MRSAVGSIPGRGPTIQHTSWPKNQNAKQKQNCNKFNKDLNIKAKQKTCLFQSLSCETVHKSKYFWLKDQTQWSPGGRVSNSPLIIVLQSYPEPPCQKGHCPTPVLLPGKSHRWRSLVGCSPWGRKESDKTVRLPFYFSFSCTGEGNGNPLLCSCLENPRDGRAWWAAVYGVAQSWTRLKPLSSSSSSMVNLGGLHI